MGPFAVVICTAPVLALPQELQAGLDTAAVLRQLVQQRHHALAEDWAATLGRDLQVRQQHQKFYGRCTHRLVELGA